MKKNNEDLNEEKLDIPNINIENDDMSNEEKEEKNLQDEQEERNKEDDKNKEEEEIEKLKEVLKNMNKNNSNNKNNGNRFKLGPHFFFLIMAMIIAGLYFTFGSFPTSFNEKKDITYTQFLNKIKNGDIKEISEFEDTLIGLKKNTGKVEEFKTKKVTSRIGNDTVLMNLINEKNVELNVEGSSYTSVISRILINYLPIILLVFFFIYINKSIMGGGAGGGLNLNPIKTKKKLKEKPTVKFDDVAGLVEEKKELVEIVEFLKNPKRFEIAGARVPKGVLLLGEPGTGKTLLAKAVAGESGASFFSISGSEFVELYVGVGAARVRELFSEAKKQTPAIIFIDEIDAVGRRRGQNKNGGNDEREQTLNQLLVEMDGFETDQRIIVIAATNRADVLDPALLRGGRFDRRIEVARPDLNARVEILKVHSRNKKLSENVKLEDIAKITPGFVGADLENLINEAAILAARKNSPIITMEDLDEAVDKVGMGLGQKSKIISERDKKMLAYHEGGHALIASIVPQASKVHKVTIIPRGDAGGYMMPLPEETLGKTRSQILAEINVLFAGRAAEELMLDDIATGAYSDIKRATELARLLITKVGMNDILGPVNYEQSENDYSFVSSISNETAKEIDIEVRKLLKDKYEQTKMLLIENEDKLKNIANLLLLKETVSGASIRALAKGLSLDEVISMKEEELEKFY